MPHIEHFGEPLPGEASADGFPAGIDMRADAWQPIFDDRHADQVVLPILALSGDVRDAVQEQLTQEMREAILKRQERCMTAISV